jgi:hypothetical protein
VTNHLIISNDKDFTAEYLEKDTCPWQGGAVGWGGEMG